MYMKRLAAPKHYPIPKKEKKYTVAARPGAHQTGESIPLLILARDVLGLVSTAKEAKKIIKAGEIKVDKQIIRDYKYGAGLMDVVEITKLKECFRILPKKGKLLPDRITGDKTKMKLCKIKNKTLLKKGQLQLNLHDGRNLIVKIKDPKKPTEDIYKRGDTLVISLPEQKILKHIPLKEGNLGMIIDGKYRGKVGKIKKIIVLNKMKANRARIDSDGKKFKTLKDYIFVIGENKPEITLPE